MDEQLQTEPLRAHAGKYLSLMLADETYCINVLKIREIVALLPVTPVPRMPDFIKGVINLRGRILPVVDLRVRFQMRQKKATCIVVVESDNAAGKIQMGILADDVCEVLHLSEKDLEPVPSFGAKVNTAFLLGITRVDGGVKFLLDTDRALDHEEFLLAEAARTMMTPAVNVSADGVAIREGA